MKISGKFSGKELRAVSGINLIIQVIQNLDELKKELETLDIREIREKEEELSRKAKELRAIMGTAGNTIANDFFIWKVNQLDHELHKRFRYIPKIKRAIDDVSESFNIAAGMHFQNYEKIKQYAMVKALGGESVLDTPQIHYDKSGYTNPGGEDIELD